MKARSARGVVVSLGLSQMICWGAGYYLIGVFGEAIVADVGWGRAEVYGGFSAALLAMAAASGAVGRGIDRRGGRRMMTAGSMLLALGCVGLGLARDLIFYYGVWLLLGVALRMTLYDAAFAVLARIAGRDAKTPIAQITLLGGLAATVFWPVGHFLIESFGWRWAAFAYAGFALLTVPLHWTLPEDSAANSPVLAESDAPAAAAAGKPDAAAAALYAFTAMLTNFLNAGMSAHMIAMMGAMGLAATTAVNAAALRGVGQSAARLCEVLFGRKLHPLNLNLIAASILAPAFVLAFWSGEATAALAFCFFYGAGNGLLTITRGSLPLALFDVRAYGAITGRLLGPGFVLAAAAPLVYALTIERFGAQGGLWLSAAAAAGLLAAAVELRRRFAAQVA